LLSFGVQVMTGGNHTWDKKEILPYFSHQPRLLRPANMPPGTPGTGRFVAQAANGVPVAVINGMGRVFMTPIDDPFRGLVAEIEAVAKEARVIFVDFHAEATSEKVAMGWHLDGRVTAVVGTHTHVQTADDRILPKGTAYLTDVGMTGPHDSVIGVERSSILQRFLTGLPQRFDVATENPRLNGVLIAADETTGRARSITRLSLSASDIEALIAQPAAPAAR
jgi:metallophosphoesterase (TIGR00282 family)